MDDIYIINREKNSLSVAQSLAEAGDIIAENLAGDKGDQLMVIHGGYMIYNVKSGHGYYDFKYDVKNMFDIDI